MITEKQIKILEDLGIQIKSHDDGIRQLGNIAKSIANKWSKLDFDDRNMLQKEFLGVELTTRQEDTNFLLKHSLKMTQELIIAMQENAEIGMGIDMLDSSEVLYKVIEKAIKSNQYVDTSCTVQLNTESTPIKYAKDHNLGFVVLKENHAKELREKYNFENIFSMEDINRAKSSDIDGVIVGLDVEYPDFDEIPVDIKTGLVDALKGI